MAYNIQPICKGLFFGLSSYSLATAALSSLKAYSVKSQRLFEGESGRTL